MTALSRDDAEEYTQALGQVVAGGWRQVALGERLGVPAALGLSTREWVEQRLGGYVRLSIPDRREAVAELAEQGMSTRRIGGVLGVDNATVHRDRVADATPPVPQSTPEPQVADPVPVAAVADATPTMDELKRRRPRSRSVRAEPAAIPEPYTVHQVLALVPPMTLWERAGLLASIRDHGLAVPIVTMPDGQTILDGRERLAACIEVGVQPRFQVYDGSDPAGTVLALNGLRYHRSPREIDQLVDEHPELEVDEGALTAAEARRLTDKLRGTLGELVEARQSLAVMLDDAPEDDRAELAETLALADSALALVAGRGGGRALAALEAGR